jgi:hypothetical protein
MYIHVYIFVLGLIHIFKGTQKRKCLQIWILGQQPSSLLIGLNVLQECTNGEVDCATRMGTCKQHSLARKQTASFLLPMAASCGEPRPSTQQKMLGNTKEVCLHSNGHDYGHAWAL